MDPEDPGSEAPPTDSAPASTPSANASGSQLARNVLNSYASYFIGIVMSLVLTRVLLRHLGASTYGLWVVLLAVTGYLGILDVGVGTAAVQRVARLRATGDREGLADLIRTCWIFFAVSAVLAVVITTVLAPFAASFLNIGTISPTLVGTTLIILGVVSAMAFLGTVPGIVLFGSGRNDRQSQIGLATLVLTELGQIIAVVCGAGLLALAVIQLAGVAVTLAVGVTLVKRITGASLRSGRFSRPLLGDLLRFGGVQSVVTLSSVVAYQLDALVIGIILPVAQVAPYNVALTTSNFTSSLSSQATGLLVPTYAHFDAVGDQERQARYFFRSVMGCLVIAAPIVIALAAYGDPILKLWLGTVPPKTYEIMVVLGLVTALQLPGHQCFLFLTGTGRNRAMVWLGIIGAVVNLGGSIAATYWLGPVGPAVGSLPVVLILDSLILPTRVCRFLGVSLRIYVRTALVPVIPVALAAGVTALALIHLHPVHTGFGAIAGAVVVCGVAWVTLAAIVARTEPDLRSAAVQRIRGLRRT